MEVVVFQIKPGASALEFFFVKELASGVFQRIPVAPFFLGDVSLPLKRANQQIVDLLFHSPGMGPVYIGFCQRFVAPVPFQFGQLIEDAHFKPGVGFLLAKPEAFLEIALRLIAILPDQGQCRSCPGSYYQFRHYGGPDGAGYRHSLDGGDVPGRLFVAPRVYFRADHPGVHVINGKGVALLFCFGQQRIHVGQDGFQFPVSYGALQFVHLSL